MGPTAVTVMTMTMIGIEVDELSKGPYDADPIFQIRTLRVPTTATQRTVSACATSPASAWPATAAQTPGAISSNTQPCRKNPVNQLWSPYPLAPLRRVEDRHEAQSLVTVTVCKSVLHAKRPNDDGLWFEIVQARTLASLLYTGRLARGIYVK